MCLMVMYCDPPINQKPAIRAEEAAVTASEKRNNDNNAIFNVNWFSCQEGRDYHAYRMYLNTLRDYYYQWRLVVSRANSKNSVFHGAYVLVALCASKSQSTLTRSIFWKK